MFLICNELEQLEFKQEKNIGIQKPAGKEEKKLYVLVFAASDLHEPQVDFKDMAL